MDDEDSSLIRFLTAEDTPNYELLDDDDEEVDAMVAAMDADSLHHSSMLERRIIPRERADGETRIIHNYFASNPLLCVANENLNPNVALSFLIRTCWPACVISCALYL